MRKVSIKSKGLFLYIYVLDTMKGEQSESTIQKHIDDFDIEIAVNESNPCTLDPHWISVIQNGDKIICPIVKEKNIEFLEINLSTKN